MSELTILLASTPDYLQKEAIRKLWNEHYPASLELKLPTDFERYLSSLSNTRHWLVVNAGKIIMGWGITFVREGETWFAIILDRSIQRKKIGSKLLESMKSANKQLSGWVIDHNMAVKLSGEFYLSPMRFYMKNGFTILSSKRLETDTISAVKIRWEK